MRNYYSFLKTSIVLVPMIIAAAWGIMTYIVIIEGRFLQFSNFIFPMLIVIVIIHLSSLFFWYKIEQYELIKRVAVLEMDSNSLLSRIEMVENITNELKEKK